MRNEYYFNIKLVLQKKTTYNDELIFLLFLLLNFVRNLIVEN